MPQIHGLHGHCDDRFSGVHDGAGGSCGPADPDAGIALGYVMIRMGSRLADDPRRRPW